MSRPPDEARAKRWHAPGSNRPKEKLPSGSGVMSIQVLPPCPRHWMLTVAVAPAGVPETLPPMESRSGRI